MPIRYHLTPSTDRLRVSDERAQSSQQHVFQWQAVWPRRRQIAAREADRSEATAAFSQSATQADARSSDPRSSDASDAHAYADAYANAIAFAYACAYAYGGACARVWRRVRLQPRFDVWRSESDRIGARVAAIEEKKQQGETLTRALGVLLRCALRSTRTLTPRRPRTSPAPPPRARRDRGAARSSTRCSMRQSPWALVACSRGRRLRNSASNRPPERMHSWAGGR